MDNLGINTVLESCLRPLTFPVAVKLQAEEDLPAKFRRPGQALGHPLNICQGVNFARRYGWSLGFLREDMACPISVLIFGFEDDPDFVTRGEHIQGDFTATMEQAAKTQAAQPKAPTGSIWSVLLAPLAKAEFRPDLVLVYGNGAQIARLVQGALYHHGGSLQSSFSGRGACAQEFIYPLQSGKCNVILPAQGERMLGMTADDELCFAIPGKELENVADGLQTTHQKGVSRVPTPFFGMRAKPVFPERYRRLEEFCGLK